MATNEPFPTPSQQLAAAGAAASGLATAPKDEAVFLEEVIGDPTKPIKPEDLIRLLQIARYKKPLGLDATSISAQKRYRGHQKVEVAAAIKERFPNTKDMPVHAINFMRMIARGDAGVYTAEPDRWFDDGNGERVKPDGKAATAFFKALKRARFQAKMMEAERRAIVTPGTVPVEVVWYKPPGDKTGYAHLRMLWVHDFNVICHRDAPTEWPFKRCVLIRQPAPTNDAKGGFWYRIYVRKAPAEIDGEWGPWFLSLRSTEDSKFVTAPTEIKGKLLPVFLVQLTEPEGSVFSYDDSDLIDVVDDLNVRRSDESYVLGKQGHAQLWTNDQSKETEEVKIGPDGLMIVNGQLDVINYNAPLEQSQSSRQYSLKELAMSRGSSPHAYDADNPTVAPSGVAKRIDNLLHDQRVEEQGTIMQVLEETEVLPIMKDVISANMPELASALDPLTPRMMPMKVKTIEDPTQKQARLVVAADRKWISEQRAATDAELYSSVEEATSAMKQLTATTTTAPPPGANADANASDPAGGGKPAPDGGGDANAGAGDQGGGQPTVTLTSTDVASIVTVDEARASQGLGPWPNTEEGKLSVTKFQANNAAVIATAAAAADGSAKNAPNPPTAGSKDPAVGGA